MFLKDYEIKIYKNPSSLSRMEYIDEDVYLEEILPNAGMAKYKILRAFSKDFRQYFNCDGGSAFSIPINNEKRTFIINYRDYDDVVYAVGAISLLHVTIEHIDDKYWALSTAWVHPFMRCKHLLKNSVEILEKKYNPFYIKDILSREMELFALKYNKKHNLHFNYYQLKKKQEEIYRTCVPNEFQ